MKSQEKSSPDTRPEVPQIGRNLKQVPREMSRILRIPESLINIEIHHHNVLAFTPNKLSNYREMKCEAEDGE